MSREIQLLRKLARVRWRLCQLPPPERTHPPARGSRVARLQLRRSSLEGELAELRQAEHLRPVPLPAEPEPLSEPEDVAIELPHPRRLEVTFRVREPVCVPGSTPGAFHLQIVFLGVRFWHLASHTREEAAEFEWGSPWAAQFRGRGFVSGLSLYEWRRSERSRELQWFAPAAPLIHWLFALPMRRLEVVAEDVTLGCHYSHAQHKARLKRRLARAALEEPF